jgi:hypothetical protein
MHWPAADVAVAAVADAAVVVDAAVSVEEVAQACASGEVVAIVARAVAGMPAVGTEAVSAAHLRCRGHPVYHRR